MSSKIDVASGDPYRADGGKFGTSPGQKLEDSIKALADKKFVKGGGNDEKVKALKEDATAKLALLRSPDGTPSKPLLDKQAQQNAIDNYVADSGAFNSPLKAAKGNDSKVAPEDRLDIAMLDVQMQDGIKENTLYRGVYADLGTLKEGDTIPNYGFASTSKDAVTGEYGSDPNGDFAAQDIAITGSSDNRKPYVMNIKIPKGSKALDLDQSGDNKHEREVILPRGTKFQITKIGKPKNADNAVDEPYDYTPLNVTAVLPEPKTFAQTREWVDGGAAEAKPQVGSGVDLKSGQDVLDHIAKVRAIDPSTATEEHKTYLKAIGDRAKKAYAAKEFPDHMPQTRVLGIEADYKLKEIDLAKKGAADAQANRAAVDDLFSKLNISPEDQKKIEDDYSANNPYSIEALNAREGETPESMSAIIADAQRRTQNYDKLESQGLLSRTTGAKDGKTLNYKKGQVVSRAGDLKSAGGRGIFFYLGADDGNNNYEQVWSERLGVSVKAKNYELRPGLKILMAHDRNETARHFDPAGAMKASRSGKDQYATEQVVAKALRANGYDGVYYDGYGSGTDQSGELTLMDKKHVTELQDKTTKPADNAAANLVTNANITPDQQRQIDLATEQFKQSVQRVDNQILNQYIQAIQDGDYAAAEAILENAAESQQTATLMFALLTIGTILLPLYARQRIQNLLVQFGLHTVFAQTDSGQKALREQAQKGAKSHVQTIAKDLKNNLDDAIDEELPTVRQGMEERFPSLKGKDQKGYLNDVRDNKDMYQYARQLILSGTSRDTVIKKLQEKFSGISKKRANVIAGNESNRIFTLSQFEADEQFLAQNKLTDKAYKRLVSNTGHPCPICNSIIEKTHAHPIPFKNDFAEFGKEMKVKYEVAGKQRTLKFTPNYEHLRSGHIHVNCHCRYELLIKRDDGTWLNSNTGKVENDFLEDLHPRDRKGKFAKKGVTSPVDFRKLADLKSFDDFVETNYWDGTFGDQQPEVTDAVRAYQGHYYDAINIHARGGNLDQPLNVYGENTTYQKTVDNINAAANISLATDTTLYRGTEIPYHQVNHVGEAIHARSFLSTTSVQSVSKDFKHKGGSTLVITAKKGQKVILPDLVTFGKRGRTMGEAEVLIPTGSVLSITRINGDVVYAELN